MTLRIAHTADWHIGLVQYPYTNQFGVNRRSADLVVTLRRFVDAVIAARADVLLVGGDVHNSISPGNLARVEVQSQLRRVSDALPELITVLVSGNHETPRTIAAGSPMPLYDGLPRVTLAWQEVKRVVRGDLLITAVPHAALVHGEPFAPDPSYRHNVLLIHGAVPGLRHNLSREEQIAGQVLDRERQAGWDYVALGDWHVCRQVAPNAWYSGSLDFCSSDPWSEIREANAAKLQSPKGWLLVEIGQQAGGANPASEDRMPSRGGDAVSPVVSFQPLPVAREYIDFPAIQSEGDPSVVNEALEAIPPIQVRDCVARLVVHGLPRLARQQLNHAHLKALKRSALHFHLDCRVPERSRSVFAVELDPAMNYRRDALAPGGSVPDDLEPWEIEQEHAAHYLEPEEYQTAEPLPTLAELQSGIDPYLPQCP